MQSDNPEKSAAILVIDDEEPIREYLRFVLEAAGHRVTCAEDGEAGLHAFAKNRFDTVVTDIAMPRTDGVEAIIAMRQCYPRVPIVAMSGAQAKERLLTIATIFEADILLQKPFTRQEALGAIDQALLHAHRTGEVAS